MGETVSERGSGTFHVVLAGLIAAVVGFTSSFAVVLTGLRAVGASDTQAASGLAALCLAMGLSALLLSTRLRMPVSVAWSTPGAALLASTGAPAGGFAAAVGAFLVAGVLLVAAGLWGPLGRAIAAIPAPLANAMLAGVLLSLCLAPARAAVEIPRLALPVVVVWLLLTRWAPRWAVPGALAVAAVGVGLDTPAGLGDALRGTSVLAAPDPVAPELALPAVIGLAVPLFLVTMASQNIPGMGVLASYGYRPSLRPLLGVTGAATVAAAPFGGHAVNLAALTAALAAGPSAGPDPQRRWIAGATSGIAYVVLGLLGGLVTALAGLAPVLLLQAVAGLALLGALTSALRAALDDAGMRDAAVVTLVVTVSGVSVGGVGSAFWGLVAGWAVLALTRLPAAVHSAPAAPRPR
ncbi:benzoate/H(+) symporter BenE family transporter [Motilibacter aurantiacus]|uniref:benzoate/H(+) symporter BenE family transporter n=1 Tax=Motilibacter aurantiacus TaxID=2714955 RepID=UPI00140A853A|nr:benzoate/H(+) symporter BenE family transporter [Motilibacter aurantiacus]NHC45524.1 benzoate/H(+) symporter BenE family transporter [Motilibacter aurantiacus]